MQPQGNQYTTVIGEKTTVFETGKLAGQSGGAVTLRLGDSVIFASATMSNNVREGIDFLPLSVDYEQRMYASGHIPGSFFRREGRPSDYAVIVARLTDRPLRPLFDKNLRNEIQVILFSISADIENPLDILAINAASAALMISDIPWGGPVGAVRIGRINGKFVVNPIFSQMEMSDLDLRLAGTSDAILMVECGSDVIDEDVIISAISFGHQALQPFIEVQEKMAAEVGKQKREVELHQSDAELSSQVYEKVNQNIQEVLSTPHKKSDLDKAITAIKENVVEELAAQDEELAPQVKEAFSDAYKRIVRARIIKKDARPDGRSLTDIRPIWCEVGTSPRAHGSGLFTRGETQVLTFATLGTPKEAQSLDDLTPTESNSYMHHYNFPPYSTGEVGRIYRSRRAIGHGALAQRALVPVLPDKKDFPYTMRLVSECLSSNGSTSMASVCGSTLALMDTGVPIKAPVAGVAMGLIKENEDYKILTDIQGIEDYLGDMDFKVAGTAKGITALQMDIKIKGITPAIMSEALQQAHQARLFILGKMAEAIPEPRPELKEFVPRITTMQVPIEKIGAIIGPSGKTIRSIQEETNTRIDIDDDGTIYISASDRKNESEARKRIEQLTESPVIGRIYTGKVVRTTDFGAFVEILPGVDGLVHISQLDSERIEKVEDIARVGDDLTVMITNIDPTGKIRLSRQAILEGWSAEEARERDSRSKKRSSSRRPSGRGRSNYNHDNRRSKS
ncbi:MAG TPA: polyribonucleotide nucleotidyltransferase [Anaerolineae bacterium]|nr:polyribonucleotide nucleotidyltransferase [Anaerolineae bacterium]